MNGVFIEFIVKINMKAKNVAKFLKMLHET